MFADLPLENGSKLGPKIKGCFFTVCVGLALSGGVLLTEFFKVYAFRIANKKKIAKLQMRLSGLSDEITISKQKRGRLVFK